jgi:hypothetical protein
MAEHGIGGTERLFSPVELLLYRGLVGLGQGSPNSIISGVKQKNVNRNGIVRKRSDRIIWIPFATGQHDMK